MKADAPLIAYCLFLLGCACFSLLLAFQGKQAILCAHSGEGIQLFRRKVSTDAG
jgi:hypothetical protein